MGKRWQTTKIYWHELRNYFKNERIGVVVRYCYRNFNDCYEQLVWQLNKSIPKSVRFEQVYPDNVIKIDIIKIPWRIYRLHLGHWQKYVQKYYQKRYLQFDQFHLNLKAVNYLL